MKQHSLMWPEWCMNGGWLLWPPPLVHEDEYTGSLAEELLCSHSGVEITEEMVAQRFPGLGACN